MITSVQRQPQSNSHPDRHYPDYPVELDLDYRIVVDRKILDAGRGRTVTISSTTVTFKGDHQISNGLDIEVTLEWPVRLDNSVSLRLHIHGKTVKAENGCNAIRILRHEFRTSKDTTKTLTPIPSQSCSVHTAIRPWDMTRTVPVTLP